MPALLFVMDGEHRSVIPGVVAESTPETAAFASVRGLDGPTMPDTTNKSADFFPSECCLRADHARNGEAGESFL
jgi:hypothetical protein